MVESKFVVLQMIPHTLFIEWDFWILFTTQFTSLLLFTVLFTSVILFTYTVLFMYMVLFTYTVLFIRPVFFFKCSFLDLFNLKFYA